MSGWGRLRGAAAAGLAVLALLIWGLPFPAYETATLLPVETVQLARTEDGRVLLRTEAGDGVGADWSAAVRELRANAPGTVLLDTAEQLVLCTDEPELLQEAAESGDLRPAVQLRYAAALYRIRSIAKRVGEQGVALRFFIFDLFNPFMMMALRLSLVRKVPGVWR